MFNDIFEKIDLQQPEVVTEYRRSGPVKEFWKQITPDTYMCLITNRKLSKAQFRNYQDGSACGLAGFVVQVF